MKTMFAPISKKQCQQTQAIKYLLTLSVIVTLSGCGSIQYNGFSNANTVFDIFSFTDSEETDGLNKTAGSDKTSDSNKVAASDKQEAIAKSESATHQHDMEIKQNSMVAEQKSTEQTGKNIALLQQQNIDVQKTDQDASEKTQVMSNPVETEGLESNEVMVEAVAANTETAQLSESNVTALEQVNNEAVASIQHEPSQDNENEVLISQSSSLDAGQTQSSIQTQTVAITSSVDTKASTQNDSVAVEEVNRITEQNPTAAISNDYQVLPEVQTEVADISVPNELLLLAAPAEYRPEISEYGMWKISKDDDSLYRENCTLASSTMQVSFDNYSTQVWLKVVGDDLLVNSTTNIDISKPRVGVKLDNGPILPFSKKHFSTSAVWSGNLNAALKRNKKLSVSLTGNELKGRLQEVTLELDDLKRAYAEYAKCNATTQIGSL